MPFVPHPSKLNATTARAYRCTRRQLAYTLNFASEDTQLKALDWGVPSFMMSSHVLGTVEQIIAKRTSTLLVGPSVILDVLVGVGLEVGLEVESGMGICVGLEMGHVLGEYVGLEESRAPLPSLNLLFRNERPNARPIAPRRPAASAAIPTLIQRKRLGGAGTAIMTIGDGLFATW
mmetsp:Transcript_13565/g.39552  ORF Transcript_13565/g.39552 Transcript_13565/m.39552 type:complete len:176 (-) Transcript_13565:581-1108(-)